MAKLNKIKNYVCEGLRYTLLAAALAAPLTGLEYGNLTRGYYEGYPIEESVGIKDGEKKKVESFEDKFRNAEPWRAIAHWYDPLVIRAVRFSDSSEATLEYSILANWSDMERKVLGPEPGDSCVIENNGKILKLLK